MSSQSCACGFFACIRRVRLSKNSRWVIAGIIFWALYELMLWLLGISTGGSGNLALHYCYWMSMIIFTYYYNKGRMAHLQRLAKFSLFCVVINAIDNIIINYRYPTLKDNVTILNSYGVVFDINIAFTSFAYAMVLCLVFTVYRYLKEKKVSYLLCMLPVIVLSVQLGRAIPTLALLFSLVYIYGAFMLSSRRRGNLAWHTVLLFAAAMVGTVFVAVIYANPRLLYELSPSQAVADKLYTFLTSDRGSGHHRIELAMLSVDTWLSSIKTFFFGIGFHVAEIVGQDFTEVYNLGIGSHSHFFDTLGYYGIFGFTIIVSILWRFYREIFAGLHDDVKRMAVLVPILLIVLNLFSSLYTVDCGVMLFIFIPATLLRYKGAREHAELSEKRS